MAGKIQDADIKSVAELVSAGATAASLPNDDKVYVTANSVNKTLKQAIIDGDIGGGLGVSTIPTVQKFLSGSGTYTTPAHVSYIRVRMVGGGAGGSGSGTSNNGGIGGAGGNSTFGTSLLTAGGASAGPNSYTYGYGGTATINSPAVQIAAVVGGTGGPGSQHGTPDANAFFSGGSGATTIFGGGGGGTLGGSPGAGASNSGAGGGGAGASNVTNSTTGAGGSAGGYVEAIISSPSANYSYSVGTGGSAGTAGTSGFAGAAGGSGYIEVTEYYSSTGTSTATNDDVGTIIPSASATPPSGAFLADGSAVSRTTYAALFTKIGTTFGVGDGSTTFNIPNLQGVFLRGSGSQTISGIVYSGTAGTAQGDQMQGHYHASLVTNFVTNSSNNAQGSPGVFGGGSPATTTGGPVTDGVNGTPRTGSETRPANVAAYYHIRHTPSTGIGTAPQSFIAPTIQKFTSGSGTYTLPSSPRAPLYIRVRMVGAGGGGAGSGSSAGTAAGAGGNTTFGTSLLVANGGSAAAWNGTGALGGSASLGTGPIGTIIQGGTGFGIYTQNISSPCPGGAGGSSPLYGGGGGNAGYNTAGSAGTANTGGGGQGGGNNNSASVESGPGGGAGGCIDAIINSPSSTYSYSIGSGGSGGGAGGSGFAGGAGGSGYIEVTEYYQ